MLRTVVECRKSEEIRNAVWPPLPPDAVAVAFTALQQNDFETALVILRPAAKAGDRVAQHNLGVMYITGRGVPQDFSAAESFFRMAAGNRYAPAFHSLGLMFGRGEGVRVDLIESYKWLELARRELASHAEPSLMAQVSEGQRTLAGRLTPEQVEIAVHRADAWGPDSPHHARLAELKTIKDYNALCQTYENINDGIRQLDNLIRAERVTGKFDLLTCLAVIEYSRMTKNCDGRDPVLGELLFYLKFLDSPEIQRRAGTMLAPSAAVSTALVIGSYCKANQPQPGADATFAKLRAAYREGAQRR